MKRNCKVKVQADLDYCDGRKIFKCHCGKQYLSNSARWLHIKTKHGNDDAFKEERKSQPRCREFELKKVLAIEKDELEKNFENQGRSEVVVFQGIEGVAVQKFCEILMQENEKKVNFLSDVRQICKNEFLSDYFTDYRKKQRVVKFNEELGLYEQTTINCLCEFLIQVKKVVKLDLYKCLAFLFLAIVYNGVIKKNINKTEQLFEESIQNIGQYESYIFQTVLKKFQKKHPLMYFQMFEDQKFKRLMELFNLWLFLKKYSPISVRINRNLP